MEQNRESELSIDYSKYANPLIHRRHLMIKRADSITYRTRNKRRIEILKIVKDDLSEAVMKYATRKKYLDEHGKLIFIDED